MVQEKSEKVARLVAQKKVVQILKEIFHEDLHISRQNHQEKMKRIMGRLEMIISKI